MTLRLLRAAAGTNAGWCGPANEHAFSTVQDRERASDCEVVFKRLYVGETRACVRRRWPSTRDRVSGAVDLRHRSQALNRAHLRPSRLHRRRVLPKPLVVAPAFLQHPENVAAELPRRGRRRLRFPLRAEQVSIVRADRPRRQLQRLHDPHQDPLEPVIAHLGERSIGSSSPPPAPRRRHQARVRGQ